MLTLLRDVSMAPGSRSVRLSATIRGHPPQSAGSAFPCSSLWRTSNVVANIERSAYRHGTVNGASLRPSF